MMQLESYKRRSPSPSRSSARSDGRALRQPRVIRVNRDAATTTAAEGEPGGSGAPGRERRVRSRTFSDGFLRNTSLELLLGAECEACLALAAQRRLRACDLVCDCGERRSGLLHPRRDVTRRGRTLDIYDLERIKSESGRSRLDLGSHRSLDGKFGKSKTIGVSNYISKRLISYDPRSTLVQRIKRKLSNLKKMGGDAISKKHQNATQLAEITAGSTSSLKRLSMLAADGPQGRVNSHSCIFSSSRGKEDVKSTVSTYANFSGNVDRCSDGVRDCDASESGGWGGWGAGPVGAVLTMRSVEEGEEPPRRRAPALHVKYSTLDGRGRCRTVRRQLSYDEFPSERCPGRAGAGAGGTWAWEAEACEAEACEAGGAWAREAEETCEAQACEALRARCTCEPRARLPACYYDTHSKKPLPPAPDVTAGGPAGGRACRACRTPQWLPPGTTSSTSRSSSVTGNSSRVSAWRRRWWCAALLVLVAGSACVAGPLALRAPPGAPLQDRLRLAARLLHDAPLVDGHNDLPWNIRKFLHNQIKDFSFDEDLRTISPWATSSWSHTDLPRLKQGRVSAQFWAAYVPCDAQHRDAVQLTFEQIDLIQRLTEKYHPQLTLCTTAEDIVSAHANHRLCSLVGVEGGHAIGGSLAVLRALYQLGVRYLTLTSTCDTPWAECAASAPGTAPGTAPGNTPGPDKAEPALQGGLSPFGKVVVAEMNRLGMLVDLSHVSERTMRDALAVSRAPVLFSHSAARALCNVSRNVPDAVLRLLAANRGLVMVNFYTSFLACRETATVHDAIAHINHIRDVAGVDCVGLGAGYDGINYTPQGLEDVSSYPLLFAELMEEGWSADELRKLAGQNLLRVLAAAEGVARELAAREPPHEELAPRAPDRHNCSSRDL